MDGTADGGHPGTSAWEVCEETGLASEVAEVGLTAGSGLFGVSIYFQEEYKISGSR